MFTGLIEEIGTIKSIRQNSNSSQITIHASHVMEHTKIGDSICTNGVCLTVVALSMGSFTVDAVSETLLKTNLSELKIGDKVNLERAMRLNDRIGGHMVSGHIDGIGKILLIEKNKKSWYIKIAASPNLLNQMIDKGSVAIDGISLTISAVKDEYLSVNIIPHTALETTLVAKKTGDYVNIETDMIGKYIYRYLNTANKSSKGNLDQSFLAKNGFIS